MFDLLLLGLLFAILPAGFARFIAFFVSDEPRTAFIACGLVALVVVGGTMAIGGRHTHDGTATGYVTAVETGGLLYKTTTLYLKTDAESSQEDSYCVANGVDIEALRSASVARQRIEVQFRQYVAWTEGCEFDDGTAITGFRVVA